MTNEQKHEIGMLIYNFDPYGQNELQEEEYAELLIDDDPEELIAGLIAWYITDEMLCPEWEEGIKEFNELIDSIRTIAGRS